MEFVDCGKQHIPRFGPPFNLSVVLSTDIYATLGFNLPDARSVATEAVVVVVEDEGKRLGVLADDLLGQQSIVIKSLGE